VADWWFDLPWLGRFLLALVDLTFLGGIYWYRLDKPLRKSLSLFVAALLVEKRWPHLRQSLVSVVQFEGKGAQKSTVGSSQLKGILQQRVLAQTRNLNLNEVVSLKELYRMLVVVGVLVSFSLILARMTSPASGLLLERLCLLNVTLPTKTTVVPITEDITVPIGSDVDISAEAKGLIPGSGRVNLAYQGLASQDLVVRANPDKPGTFTYSIHNIQKECTYIFYLNDGHGLEYKITPKTPPELTDLQCEQVFPVYTHLPSRKVDPTDLSLLMGSHLLIKAKSTTPLRSATVVLTGINKTLEVQLTPTSSDLTADIPITDKDLAGFSVHLTDESNFESVNDTDHPITPVPDLPPVVKVNEPREDHEAVTVQAHPTVEFDATDDFGLTALSLRYQIVTPPVAGQSPSNPPVQSIPIPLTPSRHLYSCTLPGPFQEGVNVVYWIEAVDNNTLTGPGITKTDPRQFTIVSAAEKETELLGRLKENSTKLEDLSKDQDKLNKILREAVPNN
jgi:hypothetical protein